MTSKSPTAVTNPWCCIVTCIVLLAPTACETNNGQSSSGQSGGGAVNTHDCSGPVVSGELGVNAIDYAPSVDVYGVWELGFDIAGNVQGSDRYNPSKADIKMSVIRPDNKVEEVTGFFKQEASPQWAVRYAPRVPGVHQVSLQGTVLGKVGGASGVCFSAGPSFGQPFVVVDPVNPARLMTTAGNAFVPVGLNAPGCPSQGDGSYAAAFASLKAFNFNTARIWAQARWGSHPFERLNPPGESAAWQCGEKNTFTDELGNYSLDGAARVDQIFTNAKQQEMYVMWTLALHEDWKYPADFATNPYTPLISGCTPANNCQGFWTEPTAVEMIKRNLRYTYARWGAYSSLAIMELYNEADQGFLHEANNPQGYDSWHAALANLWKTELGDIYNRPLTTSFAWTDHWTGNNVPPAISWGETYNTWNNLPDLDISQQHFYSLDADSDERMITEVIKTQPLGAGARGKRPFFFGEIGLPAPHWHGSDPNGYFYTDVAWVPFFFAEAMGSGFRWWLEGFKSYGAVYVLPTAELDTGYRCFGAFVNGELEELRTETHFSRQPLTGNIEVAGYKSSQRALVMVRDFSAKWNTQNPTTHSAVMLSLDGFSDGVLQVEFWPLQGDSCAAISTTSATVSGGTLTVALPTFQRGLGVRVRP